MRAWTLAALLSMMLAAGTAAATWTAAKVVDGVPVQAKPTDSGFNVHRAQTMVCTDLDALEAFVMDTSNFQDWIPFTRSAELLDRSAADLVYYVRSTTPWPFKDRDMIYRISREETEDHGLRLLVTGHPDYRPAVANAERILAATGEWYLLQGAEGIRVDYTLYVHPGEVPRMLANRRLATAVGQTLANLAARFPCTPG